MFELKEYQKEALKALRTYLEDARFKGAEAAYKELEKTGVPGWRPYQPMQEMKSVPFICVRLPTGGGKTLLSAHTVKIAGETYLETEYPLVLWLVPTNTIRTQTLETLKKAGHSNYETLREAFDGRFLVLDIEDFIQIRPQDLKSKAVIVVGTIQTLRVNSTEGRKVYAHNENLEPHFTKVTEMQDLERIEGGENAGRIKFSFRNLLHIHRPLVIIDEAHNASSDLSFEVLQRINAACVIEYTATPAKSSNILYNVSASELKSEEMIKLPILLTEHKTWEEAVGDAVRTRSRLHEFARNDKDYIRPIVLFQAEKKDKEITKEVILDYLVNQEKIDRGRIAVVTGDQRELDGIDLFDPSCSIDFVITIEALKEGWDCSFAYVFCSVATVHSKKDVEQILGRVLRMPYAKRRTQEELNKAYAHVSSISWPQSVRLLHDRLVNMGFDPEEADGFIQPQQRFQFPDNLSEKPHQKLEPLIVELNEEPDLTQLHPDERSSFTVEKHDAGVTLKIAGNISNQAADKLVSAVPPGDRENLQINIKVYQAEWKKIVSPAQRGIPFNVPQLCLWIDDELELAEKELFLDARGWNLLSYPSELTEAEFKLTDNGKKYEIDIIGEHLRERLVGETDQLNLDLVDTGWTDLQLSRWLDNRLRQPDIRQEMLLEYARKMVNFLDGKRGIPIPALVRARFLLVKILQEKIRLFRKDAYEKGYQQTLFGSDAKVETSFRYNFSFCPNEYSPRWSYTGSYQFNKHFYDRVGQLKSQGEEFDCAKAIDVHPAVKHWVRNFDRHEKSFWLPTSSDKFYPDFVVELNDGRILVVEYKGEHLIEGEKEKLNIGQLWEEKSAGKALFLMALKKRRSGKGRLQPDSY